MIDEPALPPPPVPVDPEFGRQLRLTDRRYNPPPAWPPIVANDDPWTSHVAAERIEPKRGTRRAQVLDRLRAAAGAWVPGVDLATRDCGGSEGLKRIRELRQLGWPVERRPIRGPGRTAWEYRLPVADDPASLPL